MPNLTIRDMMVPNVKALREDDSITLADWEMTIAELRHLPVVDAKRRVVGIVSDRDVLRTAAEHPGELIPVGEIMTREVFVIRETAPAIEAAQRMIASKRSSLPVVDTDGILIGIVTTTDFVELARRALSGLDVNVPHVRA
jgi:CBS domain-containing protein